MSNRSFYVSTLGLGPQEANPGPNLHTFAGLVGEAINVSARTPAGEFTGTVASAPNGSSAEFSAGSFTPDVPGDYTLRLANGSTPPTGTANGNSSGDVD